jgi:shikimate dehydrogenase
MITGTTQTLAVIGYPIAHSLSPVMHNAAIQTLGVDYVYIPCAIAPSDLETAIAGLRTIGTQGFSVTIPHKQTIMPLLTEVSDVAQAIGAVNTVYRTATGWGGTNTDMVGFLAPLQTMQRDWQNTTALILGNGGAARAVVAGCATLGCSQVQVVGRDRQKLNVFQTSWQSSPIQVNLSTHLWAELPQLIQSADLIVNCTPIGMHPKMDQSPLSDPEVHLIRAGAIAYDLIYSPRPTKFLHQAQTQGATAIDGLEMLVQQGAAALQLWLSQLGCEKPVPVDVMRQALINKLR